MPEITDQELLAAQRAVQLISQLQGNVEARTHLERGLKILDPKVETSEDAAARLAKPYTDKLDEMQKRWDEREAADQKAREEAAERAALAKLEDGFNRLRKEGVTDEGMEKIKALMTERTIPDPEAAFALFQRTNPPPPAEQEASYTPSHWNFESDLMPNAKDWFENPEKAEDAAIAGALADERRRNSGE